MSSTFYKWLGMTVWKFAIAYVRQTYGTKIRVGAALAALGLVAAGAAGGYLAARSGD